MDALARLEPIVRPLLREVDSALATLGAPPDHEVWLLLRRLGTTPGDAVTHFSETEPRPLNPASLRDEAMALDGMRLPDGAGWHGTAGEAYAAQARALDSHLRGMAGQLRATASYVDAVADWLRVSRGQIARTLADVMASTQAVAVRSCPTLGRGAVEALRRSGGGAGLAGAVLAAADIGAVILRTADEALVAGADLQRAWVPRLGEIAYRAPAPAVLLRERTIRFEH